MNEAFSVLGLLSNAVLPAAASVLRDSEIDSLSLGPQPPPGFARAGADPDGLWLVIHAKQEPFMISINREAVANVGWEGLRNHLAEELRTFVAESRFGWGQNR